MDDVMFSHHGTNRWMALDKIRLHSRLTSSNMPTLPYEFEPAEATNTEYNVR